ncbi:hypothetical protein AAVH_21078 [Aphelenchoides avenae]|nr:hypothetical protein AAVH_21078 [Aphelenchus avenae]
MDVFNDDTFLTNGFARLDTRSRSGTPEETTERVSRRDTHTARTVPPVHVQPKIRSFSEMALTRAGLEASASLFTGSDETNTLASATNTTRAASSSLKRRHNGSVVEPRLDSAAQNDKCSGKPAERQRKKSRRKSGITSAGAININDLPSAPLPDIANLLAGIPQQKSQPDEGDCDEPTAKRKTREKDKEGDNESHEDEEKLAQYMEKFGANLAPFIPQEECVQLGDVAFKDFMPEMDLSQFFFEATTFDEKESKLTSLETWNACLPVF